MAMIIGLDCDSKGRVKSDCTCNAYDHGKRVMYCKEHDMARCASCDLLCETDDMYHERETSGDRYCSDCQREWNERSQRG